MLIVFASTCELLPLLTNHRKLHVNAALPEIAADSVRSRDEVLRGSLPCRLRPTPLKRTSGLVGTGGLGTVLQPAEANCTSRLYAAESAAGDATQSFIIVNQVKKMPVPLKF